VRFVPLVDDEPPPSTDPRRVSTARTGRGDGRASASITTSDASDSPALMDAPAAWITDAVSPVVSLIVVDVAVVDAVVVVLNSRRRTSRLVLLHMVHYSRRNGQGLLNPFEEGKPPDPVV
jgi:hypothetical protein